MLPGGCDAIANDSGQGDFRRRSTGRERTDDKGRQEQRRLAPRLVGSDVVSISPEARAALAGATPGEAEQADRTSGAREAFTNYMDKARNRAQEEESGDKLEQLRKNSRNCAIVWLRS